MLHRPPAGDWITPAIGLLGAVVAWADGQIDAVALLAAIWAAAQACFIRAGIANEVDRNRSPVATGTISGDDDNGQE